MPRKRRQNKPQPSTRQPGETRGRPTMVEVKLMCKHSINGIEYGPGRVRVTTDLASVFMENERNYNWTENYLRSQGSAMIGGGSRLLDSRGRPAHLGEQALPEGFFDNPNSDLAISPVARVSGA